MKLDRNVNPDGKGKYALIQLRVDHPVYHTQPMADGRIIRIHPSAVDYGDNPDTAFFVIRLKDKYAAAALRAYAKEARQDDAEYANEIDELADIAESHPSKKRPD